MKADKTNPDKLSVAESESVVNDLPGETPDDGAPGVPADVPADAPKELYGSKGPEPTRYGDWEQKGRCSDF